MKPRALQRLFVGCFVASVIFAGCGSNGTPAPPSGLQYNVDTTYRWWWNISNETNKNDPGHPKGEYVWVTRYYDDHNVLRPFQIAGADCVAPGQTIQRDILFGRAADGYGTSETVKLRAEVKAYDAKDCNAPTISDFYGETCSGHLTTDHHYIDFWWLGIQKIVVRPPHFEADTHCKLSEGGGSPPPPPPGAVNNDYKYWWYDITNDTGKNDPDHPKGEYLWVTRYRGERHDYGTDWNIAGADCVAPGETIRRDIRYDSDTKWFGSQLRVEVKAYDAKDCNANNISDFRGPQCGSNFNDGITWILGTGKIVVRPPHFNIDVDCKSASGTGTPPPLAGVVIHDGS